ncbi:MAG: glycerol-3-phosphate 1-O-acyltransferase PlsY [Spirochaetes bacterium]|jgi:glycerol-3-phosphate acyltransferase PlsY|nr:glycerol-3-phosphate 1-O-acyltransferase PlsY [Spirochaetota bacterium]
MSWLSFALALLVAYLLGSIPTSIIVGKLFFKLDIRERGSGNAGATNAFRVLGPVPGSACIIVDVGKGAAAVLIAAVLPTAPIAPLVVKLLAGAAAVAGHMWTIFARFRGGKGVGTAAGMLLAIYPVSLLLAVAVFLIVAMATGYVSLGSITGAISFPIIAVVLSATGVREIAPTLLIVAIPISLLIVYRHRTNIRRLLRGEENRFEKLMLFRRLLRALSGRKQRPG